MKYLESAPSSYTPIQENFLSWFLDVVTRNIKIPRGGIFLLGNKLMYMMYRSIKT